MTFSKQKSSSALDPEDREFPLAEEEGMSFFSIPKNEEEEMEDESRYFGSSYAPPVQKKFAKKASPSRRYSSYEKSFPLKVSRSAPIIKKQIPQIDSPPNTLSGKKIPISITKSSQKGIFSDGVLPNKRHPVYEETTPENNISVVQESSLEIHPSLDPFVIPVNQKTPEPAFPDAVDAEDLFIPKTLFPSLPPEDIFSTEKKDEEEFSLSIPPQIFDPSSSLEEKGASEDVLSFLEDKEKNVDTEKTEDFPGSLLWQETTNSFWKRGWEKVSSIVSRFGTNPKFAYSYAFLGAALLFGVGTLSYILYGVSLQGSVLGVSQQGMGSALSAVEDLKKQEFSASSEKFEQAAQSFREGAEAISSWAGVLSDIPAPIPILSKISSAKFALQAGEHLANAGKYMSELAKTAQKIENPLQKNISLLELFKSSLDLSEKARAELGIAQENLDKVRLNDIPEEKRGQFAQLKNTLPTLLAGLDAVHNNAPAFTDILGGNGPRKYLFLFQNNQEARATGGFIGSYGLLDMKDGEIRNFFINGIFDPDGQLKVDIVPPQPIRKISAGWSLHDSNWFADFPTSAEKAIFFYEKTGGATVDGVITITPTVLQRLLQATGPIFLPEYDVTVSADNVIQTLQYKVEEDYDKVENKPKKILGDLAPLLLERVFHMKDASSVEHIVDAIHTSLREKDILLYSRNTALQKMYREMGWSGELRTTGSDFLSVVNTNINGYKTDGVINQTIRHNAEIQSDGTVVDTVTITRKHNGGDTPYEWWNAVNADYMRLYVPKGSTLLSVTGQTRETVKDPVNYDALKFQRDDLVTKIERSTVVDAKSGTQIFEESGKTVFGNWLYVSPKESATIVYTYQPPFRIVTKEQSVALYSLLTQKQSGSLASNFFATVTYPREWNVTWNSPEKMQKTPGSTSYEGSLATDVFQGYVWEVQR